MDNFLPVADRACRMLRRGNIAKPAMRISINALAGIAAVAVALAGHGARADDAPTAPASALPTTQIALPATGTPAKPAEAPLVDESAGRKIYRLVEDWVSQGKVDLKTAPAPIWVSDALAVDVTLRRVGYVLGSGQAAVPFNPGAVAAAASPSRPRTAQVVDLAALAQTATALALSDVESALAESRQRALKENEGARRGDPKTPKLDPNDPRFQTLSGLAARGELLVDLQIARGARNIAIPANARFGAVYAEFTPGMHGLCMTRITRADNKTQLAWLWPAHTLALNEDPHSQLVRLLFQLNYPRKDMDTFIEQIARPGGPLLAVFDVLHLVRPNHDQPVMLLTRGSRLVPPGSVNGPMLAAMAERLSMQLARRVRADGTMAGTYQPSIDAWDPPTATLADEAMAAYALGRRAAFLTDHPGADNELRAVKDGSRQATQYLAHQLLENRDFAQQTDYPAAAALTLMTLVESPHLADRKDQRNAVAGQLLTLRNPDGTFRSSLADKAGPISAANQALVLCALSSLYEQTREPQLLAIVRQGQQQLWKAAQDNQLAVALPWVAILDLRMHRLADKNDAGEPERWAVVSKYLAALAKEYHDKQVTAGAPAPAPGLAAAPDLAGGYELANDLVHGPPGPDWRTGYVLTFLAAYLRAVPPAPNASPADRASAVMECGEAARFLAQLMFDAPSGYYMRAVDDALGGARLKLWDNRISSMSTAVSLLAVVELQETLAAMEKAQGG